MSAPAQLSILEYQSPQPAPRATEQSQQLARVEGRIAEAILSTLRDWMEGLPPREFRMQHLTDRVVMLVGGAPDSVSRVLRALRRQGQVDYVVRNRAQSLYELRGVR